MTLRQINTGAAARQIRLLVLSAGALYLALVVTIGYVAVHFIAKFW